jgi:hypothetical protein
MRRYRVTLLVSDELYVSAFDTDDAAERAESLAANLYPNHGGIEVTDVEDLDVSGGDW